MKAAILSSAIMDSAILHKKNFTHSFWLNLMIAAMLKSAILDSAILYKKNFNHSLSVNLMMAAILNSAIMDSAILHKKKTSLIHSDSTLWWQPSWILLIWIQPFYIKLWLKLVQSDSNSFIVTQLDDGSHFEFCHLGFRHCHLGLRYLVIFSQIPSKTLFLYSDPDPN